ncbi:MAG: hypothetical protein N3E48_05010 [Candidatus Bathyarchaeota archaeon]|nr:hypothetical protein [Candidatus Bathyarchaeota archaeon]
MENKVDLTVKADRTIIVSGPALAKLVEGEVSVLGAPLNPSDEIKVRECKSLPFYCSSSAKLTLNCGKAAWLKEVEGDTIPKDWKEAVKKILIFSCKFRQLIHKFFCITDKLRNNEYSRSNNC